MPFRACRCLSVVTVTCLLLSVACPTGAAPPPPPKPKPPVSTPTKPVARIGEMLEWIAREQQKHGGFSWRGHVGFSAGEKAQFRLNPPPPAHVADTSLVALAILRTSDAKGRTLRNDVLASAVRFVEQVVEQSDPYELRLSPQLSPMAVRIGKHVDTFFALWLLAEVRTPPGPEAPADALVTKLIDKIERNVNDADGSWGKPGDALNAPLLGHAIGVRALETAHRKGFKVNPKILSAAGQYALSDAARAHNTAMSDKWKPDCGGLKPAWLIKEGVVDFEPINDALYLSAARLCVVDQADRSNAVEEQRVRERLAKPACTAELETLAASLRGIVATRKTLADARGQMFNALDKKKSIAPVIFAAEDYLAALLIVDAMGIAAVKEWFPPTVKELMFIQDVDGGVKVLDHIPCTQTRACICKHALNFPSHLCPGQLAFASRDRVFCTAATLAILVADTPYRTGFLDPKTVK